MSNKRSNQLILSLAGLTGADQAVEECVIHAGGDNIQEQEKGSPVHSDFCHSKGRQCGKLPGEVKFIDDR